jgi:transposase
MVVPDAPQNLLGDNAYDSDRLDAELKFYGIEVIAPHRRNRRNSTQDGRRLKRYRRRWKIERLFAWLQNFRRRSRRELSRDAPARIVSDPTEAFMRWVLTQMTETDIGCQTKVKTGGKAKNQRNQ